MEKARYLKRQRAHDTSQAEEAPAKRLKRNFPPVFWDSLSKIPLTPRALRELDRRNDLTRASAHRTPPTVQTTSLARFARRGGSDLHHLRGYPEPTSIRERQRTYNMSLNPSSTSPSLPSTKATTITGKTRKSSAYGKEFQQHLADHHIYMNSRKSRPANTKELQLELARERTSLSPSNFSEDAFEDFQRKNEDAAFENDVMTAVIPILNGSSAAIPNQKNVLFTELEAITNTEAVKPKPDFFNGARLLDLSPETRNNHQVKSKVIPTKHPSVPVAPNFYLEIKGPDGNAAVAQRQACYDGAYGARAMHTLQNLNEATPSYDGNAYTYSSTYHASTGTLQLYAHHMTGSAEGGQPEYHMTQLDGWSLTGNPDTFRRGVAAFRNARDLAHSHCRSFIQLANNVKDHTADVAPILSVETGRNTNDESGATNDESRAWFDADDALQRDVEGYCPSIPDESFEAKDTFHHLQAEDDLEDFSQTSTVLHHEEAPSMSFTSSFTSTSASNTNSKRPANASNTTSKRPRESQSPLSQSKRGNPSAMANK